MHDVDPLINSLYQAFDLLGVVLNGIIGGTLARRREFDIVGFVFLALFSGLAGGMIRDMLIGDGAAAAISDPWYLGLACCGALIAFLIDLKGKAWELFREHGDAIILGVWSTTGCVKALTHGMPLIPCVFLGVLTAVGGGMVRDIASGEIPSIFGGSPPVCRALYPHRHRHGYLCRLRTVCTRHGGRADRRQWHGHRVLLARLGPAPGRCSPR